MSKIYEALRRHEQSPVPGHAPEAQALRKADLDDQPGEQVYLPEEPHRPQERHPVAGSNAVDAFCGARREMQTLFRSVEPLMAGARGVIMFSSAHPGEGKTTVCGGFARTLAENFGKSVLILDADCNHVLSRKWGPPQEQDAAAGEAQAASKAVAAVGNGREPVAARGLVSVMPVGDGRGSDFATLAANRDQFLKSFDYVLIDAPSIADASWQPSAATMVDGVILVVEAERTRWPVALNAKQEFEASGARVLGVFLNKRRFYVPPRIYRHL